MSLIVSFSGRKDRQFRVGGLFRAVVSRGSFYEVQLIKVHASHPYCTEPVQTWVTGLIEQDGKLLLKRTMIRQHVTSEAEYDNLFSTILKRIRYERIIDRLERMCRVRFAREICLVELLLSRPISFDYGTLRENGAGRWARGSSFRLIGHQHCHPALRILTNGWPRAQHNQIERVAETLCAIQNGLDVKIIDNRSFEVSLGRPPQDWEVHRYFYLNQAKEGRFFIKKSAAGGIAFMDRLIHGGKMMEAEQLLSCCSEQGRVRQALLVLKRDIAETSRQFTNFRTLIESARI